MPRLLLVALDYVLLLLDPKRVVAAKGGVSLLPHQQDLQPIRATARLRLPSVWSAPSVVISGLFRGQQRRSARETL